MRSVVARGIPIGRGRSLMGHELPSGLDLRNDHDGSIVTVEGRFPLLEVDRQCRGSVGLSQFDPSETFDGMLLDIPRRRTEGGIVRSSASKGLVDGRRSYEGCMSCTRRV
jgi:hypothetical protein